MNYWKCKAAYLECALKLSQATAERDAICQAEGLDVKPGVNLEFDDQKMLITPRPQGVLAPVLSMPPASEVG